MSQTTRLTCAILSITILLASPCAAATRTFVLGSGVEVIVEEKGVDDRGFVQWEEDDMMGSAIYAIDCGTFATFRKANPWAGETGWIPQKRPPRVIEQFVCRGR